AVHSRYPAATDEEVERIAALVDGYCASPLAERLRGLAGAHAELAFAFEHDGVLLHGRIDVLHRDGPDALVVDYKTNVLGEEAPDAVVERDYRLQRVVYALACFRDGAQRVEVVYQFLERPRDLLAALYTRDDVPRLEEGLS